MIRSHNKKKYDNKSIIHGVVLALLLLTTLTGTMLGVMVYEKSKLITVQQTEIKELLEIHKEQEEQQEEIQVVKEDMKGNVDTSKFISKRQFEKYKIDQDRKLRRLEKKIQNLKALL